jgi:Rad3-related DNA helicase
MPERSKVSVDIRLFIKDEVKHLEDKIKLNTEGTERALEIATKEMERRLEGMNEFREQLEKQTRTFLTKEEYELKHQLMQQKLNIISKIVYIGIGVVIVLELVLKLL